MDQDPLVIVTRKLPESVESRMGELFNVRLNPTDQQMDKETLAQAMSVADILVPTVTDKITQDLLENAGPNLKLIANFGTGVDNIDLEGRQKSWHYRHQYPRCINR